MDGVSMNHVVLHRNLAAASSKLNWSRRTPHIFVSAPWNGCPKLTGSAGKIGADAYALTLAPVDPDAGPGSRTHDCAYTPPSAEYTPPMPINEARTSRKSTPARNGRNAKVDTTGCLHNPQRLRRSPLAQLRADSTFAPRPHRSDRTSMQIPARTHRLNVGTAGVHHRVLRILPAWDRRAHIAEPTRQRPPRPHCSDRPASASHPCPSA
ncbi:hypothetical protein B0H16DRAFT_1725585 [Mycena metata]|uniref:Uncharacterized protein n=1 Tax=Mycena metata TaxID=1033252 RepID=A0AAD7IQJ2_9AGAR|nr:hypothetical protein B0H16DRAFT_1725585 [Mycena metata]